MLRLLNAGEKAVLIDVNGERTTTFKEHADWDRFMSQQDARVRARIDERTTEEERSVHRKARGHSDDERLVVSPDG